MKVILQPQNGYINRIQALASAALLARELGAEFEVQWIPSPAAPANPESIFSPEFLECFAPSPSAWELKPYLNYDPVSAVVTLAGLDKGEQTFMPDLKSLLESDCVISEIRISAGGKFSISQKCSSFLEDRRSFYKEDLKLSSEIEGEVVSQVLAQVDYIGLHLRYSDRNHQAPTRRQTLRAVKAVCITTNVSSVFIATDTPSSLKWWRKKLQNFGISAWWFDPEIVIGNPDREAKMALIDWRILGNSKGVVYFAESSFGEEAAVASGCDRKSIGLSTSVIRTRFVRLGQHFRSTLTYPKRHFANFL